MALPALLPVPDIEHRLTVIFPATTPHRNYVTRQMAARTIFVLLYIDAVEGIGRWLGPKHVYMMSDAQAGLASETERLAYAEQALRPRFVPTGRRWFADNTREPIRDETLKEGFVALGAVIERSGIAVTSPRPRYALASDFAALLEAQLSGVAFTTAVQQWQTAHLTTAARARMTIMRQGAILIGDKVAVRLPNGDLRQLAAGPSADITKAVVEEFSPRFLKQPAVLWISESGNKVVARDDRLIGAIGLQIDAAKLLPDIILYDIDPQRPLLVFVEVVASDGPMHERRKAAFGQLAAAAGFTSTQVAFGTAFRDRDGTFKKSAADLAWQTFAWFMTEPDHIIILRETARIGGPTLADLFD